MCDCAIVSTSPEASTHCPHRRPSQASFRLAGGLQAWLGNHRRTDRWHGGICVGSGGYQSGQWPPLPRHSGRDRPARRCHSRASRPPDGGMHVKRSPSPSLRLRSIPPASPGTRTCRIGCAPSIQRLIRSPDQVSRHSEGGASSSAGHDYIASPAVRPWRKPDTTGITRRAPSHLPKENGSFLAISMQLRAWGETGVGASRVARDRSSVQAA